VIGVAGERKDTSGGAHANHLSTAVAVSFDSSNAGLIESRQLTAFVRRRPPKAAPDWIYFYLKVPRKALVGRAQVEEMALIEASQALPLATELNMAPSDIVKYCASRAVALFRVGEVELARPPITLDVLSSSTNFHPPQGVEQISTSDRLVIDALAFSTK
jgi:predicted transcriptional regulator